MPFRDLAFSDLKFYPDHLKFYLKQTKTKGPCFISIARLDSPFCSFQAIFTFALKRHKISSPSTPLPHCRGVSSIASWSFKFLGQTLFSAIFPLVSSQVTHSELGQPLQQLPKEFPQLPYKNSAAGRLQHSLHMSAQTSILCSLLIDLSALR
ncbi:hypothetical protein ILYODFUR_017816 [Ilyodon furcidens]|uniref:Uncharacterized protein n=1 Tax=Ilyodon furcidens TaxID=33524 RepID=A0ABV0U660_9TELE